MMKTNLEKITLNVAHVSEYIVDGHKSLTLVTPTSTFLDTNIPNKANSRDFTGNKNKAVKEMISTLKTEPEMFRFKNLGIRMVATDFIREEDGKIALFFDNDEGIFNGGHTYTILKTQGRDSAFINVNVDLALPKDKLAEISLALNMSKKLGENSVGEKKGAFEWIKKALPNEDISYKEGDSGKSAVEDVLKVANIFRIGIGANWSKNALTDSLRNQGKIIKENNANQTLSYTSYILSDMWDVYNSIRDNELIIKNFPDKFMKGKKLVQGLSLGLLAGVRSSMTEVNRNMIPVWKSGYNKEIAIETCERLSKQLGKEFNKKAYRDMKAEMINRNDNTHTLIQLAFLNEIK